MKVKESITKIGAVGGSLLMATMAMGSAASLGDYPEPFVEDGELASQIVVGTDGMQADVVGAIEIAAAHGQSAVQTETVTETATGVGAPGWSATDGITLDTVHDSLFFGDYLDDVRDTLTEGDVSLLDTYTFTDDGGEETDIRYHLNLGEEEMLIEFEGDGGDADGLEDEDPVLHAVLPTEDDASDGEYVFHVQANFGQDIDFTDEEVVGEDINLFGTEYTISADMEDADSDDELELFRSVQSISLSDGDEDTFTHPETGDEHTIEVQAVNEDGVVYRVDGGSWQQDGEGESFNVDGETIRIDDVINLADDAGSANFEIGADETIFDDGEPIEQDGDDVEGTYVEFDGDVEGLSGIDLYIASEDDDNDYVAAGVPFSHSFLDVELHFEGLDPDAAEGGDTITEIEVEADGDEDVYVDFTHESGDSAEVGWAHVDTDNQEWVLAVEDEDDVIHTHQGAVMAEDQYFTSDAGDFTHLWEITDVDFDDEDSEVTIEDVHTGDEVTVSNFDADNNDAAMPDGNVHGEEVIIDGQNYFFSIDEEENLKVHWGDEAGFDDHGESLSVYAPVYTDNDGAVAFVHEADFTEDERDHDLTADDITYQLPSTVVSTDLELTLSAGDEEIEASLNRGDGDVESVTAGGDGTATLEVDAGNDNQVGYTIEVAYDHDSGTSWNAADVESISLTDQDNPSLLVLQPENDDDVEHAYIIEAGDDADDLEDPETEIDSVTYTGEWSGHVDQESDDDVTVSYDVFGAYTEYDDDDDEWFTIHQPGAQAVAGAAVTDVGGELSAEGAEDVTVEVEQWAGAQVLPDTGMLDTEVTDSVMQEEHLVLVGGPAVNTLVADLADEHDDVWTQDEWLDEGEGQAHLQTVEDAFEEGQHALIVAGHSADDTRGAAAYLAKYGDHADELEDAGDRLVLDSADYPTN